MKSGDRKGTEYATGKTWSRFFLPSARDLVFVLSLWALLIGPLSNRPLADADIGWHIRTGELILAQHAIPRTDPFSSTMQGQPWFAWEWLYDVGLGLVHRTMGLNGVVWLAALVMSLTFSLLFGRLLSTGTGLPLALPLWLLALWASSIHAFARPHITSWLLTMSWFIALDEWEQGRTKPWVRWFFPLSMVLWVNLHGGWPLGLVLIAVFALAACIESLKSRDEFERILCRNRARGMGVALGLSLLATAVNPYGFSLHTHICRYLNDSFLMNRIAEFRSPDFHGSGQRCFAVILLLTLLAFAANRSRIRVSNWFIVPLMAYAGSYAARNVPTAAQLLVLIAGPSLWQAVIELSDRPAASGWVRAGAGYAAGLATRVTEQERHLKGRVWSAATTAVTLLVCIAGGRVGSQQVLRSQFDTQHLPVSAAEFLRQEKNPGPLFGPDQWGGYLIYALYPQRRVVVDDRHDLYGSQRFREYDVLVQGSPGWQAVLARWNIETVVVQSDSTLANLLRQLPRQWRTVYDDSVAVVMQRNTERQ